MNYDEKIEAAIAAHDIDQLLKYAYGDTCRCTTVKGEPMCVCKMLSAALRKKVIPKSLFAKKIERTSAQ